MAPVVEAPVVVAPVVVTPAVVTAEAETQTGRVYTCDTCVTCSVCRTKRQLPRNATPDERRIYEDAVYFALQFEYRRTYNKTGATQGHPTAAQQRVEQWKENIL